jgi:hypothetical protein
VTRSFPPPWSVEETDACFIVRDHNGQALAYVYCEDEPGRRAAAKLLTLFQPTDSWSLDRVAALFPFDQSNGRPICD